MPKNDPEYMREYQRRRRAQAKLTPAQQKEINERKFPETHLRHDWQRDGDWVECECGARKKKDPDKLENRYTDGLPDWPELIQKMPVKEIDRILDRVNTKSKRAE
jgi:hypothetical protein